jgi:uncharacterized protein YbjT (DUF2867 family)
MRIGVVGGHGKIALKLTRLLIERGDQVVSVVRNPEHAEELASLGAAPQVLDVEQAEAEDLGAAIRGCDAVVFAAGAGPGSGPERKETMDYGGAAKLIEAARAEGIPHYVMVSSRGANPEAEGDGFGVYLRAKGRADRDLQLSGVPYSIIRPGALTDDPGTGSVDLGETAKGDAVPREDVAAVISEILAQGQPLNLTLELYEGGTPIAEAVHRVRV